MWNKLHYEDKKYQSIHWSNDFKSNEHHHDQPIQSNEWPKGKIVKSSDFPIESLVQPRSITYSAHEAEPRNWYSDSRLLCDSDLQPI